MASYNNHTTHGWVSLVLNLVLITFLVIIVCCAYGKRKASWCSKKKIMIYLLLSLYALGSTISALFLFYHDHEDDHYGGDPLIQMLIWIYFASYLEIMIFYMWTINKAYCDCVEGKYSFVIMPILVLVITGLLVGIYAATPTIGAYFACFYIFWVLTIYTIIHLIYTMVVNRSFNPCYIVFIGMGLVAMVWVLGFLIFQLLLCHHCLFVFVYGTNICSISGFALIYDKEIDQLLKKWSKRQPLVAASDVDDGKKLKFKKTEKQKNITIIEEEPDTSKGDNNESDIGLEKEDDKPKKDQIVKPKVNTGPTQN